jgi:predicted Zn-dependent protease
VKVAERLVFLDPNDLQLSRKLARIYLTRHDAKRALAKLQLCFEADPRDIDTFQLLAQTFAELGQVDKAISVYEELAEVLADVGDTAGAERAQEQARHLKR